MGRSLSGLVLNKHDVRISVDGQVGDIFVMKESADGIFTEE